MDGANCRPLPRLTIPVISAVIRLWTGAGPSFAGTIITEPASLVAMQRWVSPRLRTPLEFDGGLLLILRRTGACFPFATENSVAFYVQERAPFVLVLAQGAFVAHAEFGENPGGGGIVGHAGGGDAVQLQGFESVANHGLGSLGGIAVSPVGNADPVAEFGMVVLGFDPEADAAAEHAVSAQRDGAADFVVGLVKCVGFGDEIFRVFFGIGMRDAQGHGRHIARAQ